VLVQNILTLVVPVLFYVLPFFLVALLWHLWIHYIQAKYIAKAEWIVLEVKIPKEILKTPQAMEVALGALHQTWDNDNFIKAWTEGQLRTWFSLEMMSKGGEIHFYIWTQKMFQNIIEAQFYAQYPEIEIVPAEDYVHNVPYGLPDSKWKLWGAELKLAKDDAYPIKTYIDYGLKDPPPDAASGAARTDPITATIEFLGSIAPNEQIWIQILVQATKDRKHKSGTWFGYKGWKDEGEELVKKLMKREDKKADEKTPPVVLSPGERELVERVERSLTKPGFDVGIRALYLAQEKINPARIVGTIGAFKQYNAANSNSFKPSQTVGAKYPWQDLWGQTAKKKADMFDAYRRRSYFYPPHKRTPFVLSAEELATIYHFPGSVSTTPSLAKIESKRGEPPVNLPI
jgi:hypothetical protein